MEKNFTGAVMREKQNAKMRFEFPPQESQTLAQMFGFIEVRECCPLRGVALFPGWFCWCRRCRRPQLPASRGPGLFGRTLTSFCTHKKTFSASSPAFVARPNQQNEREALCIGEYALSQTSLEQVFNGFAAQQEEELGHAAGTM